MRSSPAPLGSVAPRPSVVAVVRALTLGAVAVPTWRDAVKHVTDTVTPGFVSCSRPSVPHCLRVREVRQGDSVGMSTRRLSRRGRRRPSNGSRSRRRLNHCAIRRLFRREAGLARHQGVIAHIGTSRRRVGGLGCFFESYVVKKRIESPTPRSAAEPCELLLCNDWVGFWEA